MCLTRSTVVLQGVLLPRYDELKGRMLNNVGVTWSSETFLKRLGWKSRRRRSRKGYRKSCIRSEPTLLYPKSEDTGTLDVSNIVLGMMRVPGCKPLRLSYEDGSLSLSSKIHVFRLGMIVCEPWEPWATGARTMWEDRAYKASPLSMWASDLQIDCIKFFFNHMKCFSSWLYPIMHAVWRLILLSMVIWFLKDLYKCFCSSTWLLFSLRELPASSSALSTVTPLLTNHPTQTSAEYKECSHLVFLKNLEHASKLSR